MELSDNQLTALAGRGDAHAYHRLFERYQQPVYNFVYRMVDNAEDASDIVQNAFIKMYTVLGEKEIDNFSAYLYRTARNLAYDEIRRRQRFADVDHQILAPEDPNIYADPQRALMLGEQIGMVRRAVGKLNENQRAALILKELQDLDYDNMAEVLQSNRNAVGALLSRARLRLREELRMAQIQTEQIPAECEEVISLLSPYIDGELPEIDVKRLEAHLESCTFCSAALEEMQEASRTFRVFIPVVPPPDMAEALTGRLGELAGRAGLDKSPGEGVRSDETLVMQPRSGMHEPLEPTRVFTSGGGQSRVAHVIRSKIFWACLAGVMMFGGGAFILAEPNARNETPAPESAPAPTASTPAKTATVRTPTATTPAMSPVEDSAEEPIQTTALSEDAGPRQDEVKPPDEEETPAPAAIGIEGGSVYPNSLFEGDSLNFSVAVRGQATSVSVKIVSSAGEAVGAYQLRMTFGGSTGQQWYGSAQAPPPGTYHVIASATGAGAAGAEANLGSITVNPPSVNDSRDYPSRYYRDYPPR